MNLIRRSLAWIGLGSIVVCAVALLLVGWPGMLPMAEAVPRWVQILLWLLLVASAVALRIWSTEQLGAEPGSLGHVTRLLVSGRLQEAQKLLHAGGHGTWGRLAELAEALRRNEQFQAERAWRDQGLALIHETVRHDHTPKELAQQMTRSLARHLELAGCAIYTLDPDKSQAALHLLGTDGGLQVVMPQAIDCSPECQEELVAGAPLLRGHAIPAAVLAQVDCAYGWEVVLAPFVIESRVRGALLMVSPQAQVAALEDLMALGSTAIAVALQSSLGQQTLQASLLRANDLTRELQQHHEKLQSSEAALKKQMSYVNDILSNMHSALVVVDRSGRIQDCNQALLNMTGFARDVLIGESSGVLFEEDETRLLSIFKGYGQMLTRLGVENPEAYRNFLSESLLGALLIDSHGCIQAVNQRFAQLSGYSVSMLTGKPALELVPPSATLSMEVLAEMMAADETFYRSGMGQPLEMLSRDGRTIEVEVSLITHRFMGEITTLVLVRTDRDLPWGVVNSTALQKLTPGDEDAMVAKLRNLSGEHIPVRVSSAFLVDASGMPQQTVINLIDVSSLVNKSEEIRAQHQLLEMTMDAMQDGVLRIDRKGKLVSANPMALDLLGLDKSAMARQHVHDLLPGEQQGHDLAYWLPLRADLLLRRLVQDLHANPELVQSLPIPLLFANRLGRLKWATPTACALLGLSTPPQSASEPHLLAEQTTRELLALRALPQSPESEDAPAIVDVSWRAGNAPVMRLPTMMIDTADASNEELMVWLIPDLDALTAFMIRRAHNIEWTVLQKTDGLLVPVILTASPLEDPYNRLTGAVVTIKDMREIKEKEAENLRMIQKIEQSQRLEALGQLAAGVAHDFNNLLGVIQNHAELVEMKLGSETKAAKNLSAILQATTRARDIVLKLNALGRERKRLDEDGSVHDEQEVQTWFEVAPLIQETQGLLQASLKGIEIQVSVEEAASRVLIRGQSGALQQVLVNLCVNGSHAIGDRRNGLIKLEVSRPADGQIRLAVTDNGSGIPPDIMSRIFEPFFTTKEVGKGTGLGLSMVRSIVTQMGGSIDCQSEVGKGTCFSVLLPCVAP